MNDLYWLPSKGEKTPVRLLKGLPELLAYNTCPFKHSKKRSVSFCVTIENRIHDTCFVPEQFLKQSPEFQDYMFPFNSDMYSERSDCPIRKRYKMTKTNEIQLALFEYFVKSMAAIWVEDDEWELVVSWWPKSVNGLEETKRLLNEWTKDTKINVNLFAVDDDGNFSRGIGLNQCAKHAQNEVLFFVDADMLFTGRTIINKIQDVHSRPNSAYMPVCFKLDTTFERGYWCFWGYGMVSVERENFIEKRLKWNERRQWGVEDEMFKSQMLHRHVHVFRDECADWFHQWHPDAFSKAALRHFN